ncbi:MAG: SDR family NAD(P)-dependent oxidoreductase [Pirellulales bacterium]|nr:SDR family NAD(P)-dependent oxidoreductase [Pirellulales bacterium]
MQDTRDSTTGVGKIEAGQIDLSGKVALVTGGGRGIGATLSLVLAQAGANIAINYSTGHAEANRIRKNIEAAGGRATTICADVGDTTQCAALVRQANEAFGQVDILVSNAGIGQPHKIVDTPDEEWERVMNVNARATFALARELLPGMVDRKFGRIVAISSNIAVYGRGGGSFATYAASKAALIALTKGIAHEGAPFVTANAICPGPPARELAEDSSPAVSIQEDEPLDWLGIPMLISRKGIGEDIAHAAAYFASPAAEYVTGQTLHGSGGLFMP